MKVTLQSYLVGGAVRDSLLNRPVVDRDYVVVGSTVEDMLACGFKPVGQHFPVFLHPQTNAQYALARTERKVGVGYKGFKIYAAPTVTLEEDLARRDLTINAMAQTVSGELIDPFNGRADLEAKILRHVSVAFCEDPLRVLRVARFAARFADFRIADETLQLMQQMSHPKELLALAPERVWQELARGLMEVAPSRMFTVLRDCGALVALLPELDRLWGVPQPPRYHPEIDTGVHVMMALDYAAKQAFSLEVRFAVLMHDLGKGTTPLDVLPRHIGHEARSVTLLNLVCARWRVPQYCQNLAQLVAKFHGKLHHVRAMRADTLLDFLLDLDVVRRPQRLGLFSQACEADMRGRLGLENSPIDDTIYLARMAEVVQKIDAGAIAFALGNADGCTIYKALQQARVKALEEVIMCPS